MAAQTPVPDGVAKPGPVRLRDVPLRTIFPNLVTLLAICSGLTSIRFSIEGRLELAVAAIILAAVLDAVDGRIARFLKSTTHFGAEMDSLADFVNFGVAPAMLLYFELLDGQKAFGWIAALVFAICACLRLARFNVMAIDTEAPKWQRDFFTGIPAPAGALTVLAPVYALLVGVPPGPALSLYAAFHTLFVALLMVSNLPTFSGKNFGNKVPGRYVAPLLALVVAGIAMFASYPWETLLALSIAYFLALPLGWMTWRRHLAADAGVPPEKS